MTADLSRPSVVRDQVLIQHQAIRHELDRISQIAGERVRVEHPQQLIELLHALRDHMRGHLAFEERWLAPLLAEADVWGPQRVAALLAEHEGQRARLDALIGAVDGGWPLDSMGRAARDLVDELRADMAEEERTCLSAEFLRDDPVVIDQSDG